MMRSSSAQRSAPPWNSRSGCPVLGTESAFEVLARAQGARAAGQGDHPPRDRRAGLRHAGAHPRGGQARAREGATHYGPAAGPARAARGHRQGRGGHARDPGSPEQVVVTPGAKPIMYFVIPALVEPRRRSDLPEPGFPIYESMISFSAACRCRSRCARRAVSASTSTLLEQSVSRKTKMIILNSPQNPTGGVLERGQLGRIAEIARAAPIRCSPTRSTSVPLQGEFASITASRE